MICLAALIFAPLQKLSGQGFMDLNFESAKLVPVGGDADQFSRAFPGWTGTIMSAGDTNALYDDVPLDSSGISIIDNKAPSFLLNSLIAGRYTAILAAGLSGSGVPANTTLSQTGLVPSGTESIQFKVGGPLSPGPFAVTLGGQTLSLTALGSGANYILLGADVSQWAGQTAQLSFTLFAQNPHVSDVYLSLDDIQFSPQTVPEPGDWGLLCVAAFFWHSCIKKIRN